MSAYVIFNYTILDRSRIDELSKISKDGDRKSKYESKVIVASPVNCVEGTTLPNMVIYEFKDLKTAQNWVNEDENEATKLRKEITEGWVTIVPGYVQPTT